MNTEINMERLAKLEAWMGLDEHTGWSAKAMLVDGINRTDIKVYEWLFLYEKYRDAFTKKPGYMRSAKDLYDIRSKEFFIREDAAKGEAVGGFIKFLEFAAYLNPKSQWLPASDLSQAYLLSERVKHHKEIQKQYTPDQLIPLHPDELDRFRKNSEANQV